MTFVIESIVRSSLMVSFGLVVFALMRRQPAAFRHFILAVAIALAALQPAANLLMPSWTVPSPWVSTSVSTPFVEPAAEITQSFEVLAPAAPRPAAIDRTTWLLRVWAAGVALNLGVLFAAAIWLAWQDRRAQRAGGAWPSLADEFASSLHIRRRVRLRVTRQPALLVTWGVSNPVILLPKDAESWQPERVRLVLAHELAHVRRHDWLVQVMAEGVRALFWPNPLFWIACTRLRAESEQACDDAVLGLGISHTSYASHLVELARSFSGHGRTWLPAPSMARPSTLERRVVAMLNTTINRRPISRWRRCIAVAALVAAALPVAAAATSTAGAPSGVLRDPSGRVLPGATVRLSAIGVEARHETQSDSTGTFQFPEVPDGDYMLSAVLPGFQSGRQRIRVTASMAPLNLTLPIGMLKETVSVKSGDPEIPSPSRPMPSAPPCGSTALGGNIKPPMKLRHVSPRYRPEWKTSNVEGDVLLQVVIGTDGTVRNLEVVSPVHPDLEEEALWAVSEWQFSPTYLNCQAVEVRMFVTVSFKLDR